MATKRSLADLAVAFDQKTSGGGDLSWKKFFAFWKAPVDSTSVVRFLPDMDDDNPMEFLVENLTHELVVNGKREKVACLKMYNEDCPICALSSKYYDEKDPEHNKSLGKKYYRKKGYIGQVLVLESPVEHNAEELVKLVEFGPQVFGQIQAAFKSGDLDEKPFELKGGYNFRLRKTKTGDGQNSYITSNFSPKQTDVTDDLIEQLKLYDLNTQRTVKTPRAQLEAMLIADQTGQSVATPDRAEDTATPAQDRAETPRASVAAAKPAAESDPATPAAEAPKKLSVVEQLKLRAQQQKAAQDA